MSLFNRVDTLSAVEKGKKLIDSHKVVFFDVFDTLIVRDCAHPQDLFGYMNSVLSDKALSNQITDFKKDRIDAERAISEEIHIPTLRQIYSKLPYDQALRHQLELLEVETEQDLCVKNSIGYELYCYAVNQGKTIAAVSDMYLDSCSIKQILAQAGYRIENVFVSCEHDIGKKSGRLFLLALKQLGIQKSDVVHFGDSFQADILGSRFCGLDSMQIPLKKTPVYFREGSTSFGYKHLSPFIANRLPFCANKANAIGYEVLGPLIVGFCQWVHNIVEREQYDAVLFCARDVRQTLEIYTAMYPQDTGKTRYFFVSRESLELPYRAAIGDDRSDAAIEQLKCLLDYLGQMGCHGKVAIVDSGINGNSQKMLTAVLEGRCELHGLYMRVSKHFYTNVDSSKAFIYMNAEKPDVRQYISAAFFEALIATTHGRTQSYARDCSGVVFPILGLSNKSSELIDELQSGIDQFACDYYNSPFRDVQISPEDVQGAILRFAFHPRLEETQALMCLTGGDEKYRTVVIRDGRDLNDVRQKGTKTTRANALHTLDDLQHTYWKGGYLRLTFPRFSPVVSRLYLCLDNIFLDKLGIGANRDDSWK